MISASHARKKERVRRDRGEKTSREREKRFLPLARGREENMRERRRTRERKRERDPLFSFSLVSLINFSLKNHFSMIKISKNN